MSAEQNLNMEQRQVMRLSQQQLRFVRLLEYTAPELDEAVERELEDNPALEPGDDSSVTAVVAEKTDNTSTIQPGTSSDWRPIASAASSSSAAEAPDLSLTIPDDTDSLQENLTRQLAVKRLDPTVREAAEYIIASLDSNGYLRRTPSQIADEILFGPGTAVSEQQAKEAIEAVQSLEPPGLAASNLQECLMLQLERMHPSETRDNAITIIRNHFDAFSMKHLHRIISEAHLSPRQANDAVALILTLNPKPGSVFGGSSDRAVAIVPDIILSVEQNQILISLNNHIPELRISTTFEQSMHELQSRPRGASRRGGEFISSRYNDARDFINILRQRQQTMIDVMTAIVKIQKEYFETEDVYSLRPMMIKDIAAITGLDLSVISRATANKHVATPWGVFPLRFFFSDSIGADSDNGDTTVLTNRKIEAEIEALVNAEDKRHPLSDEKLRREMEARGFEVARRTIAKYRDRVGIPVARLRRKM